MILIDDSPIKALANLVAMALFPTPYTHIALQTDSFLNEILWHVLNKIQRVFDVHQYLDENYPLWSSINLSNDRKQHAATYALSQEQGSKTWKPKIQHTILELLLQRFLGISNTWVPAYLAFDNMHDERRYEQSLLQMIALDQIIQDLTKRTLDSQLGNF